MTWERHKPGNAPYVVLTTGERVRAPSDVFLGYADGNWRYLVFREGATRTVNYDGVERRAAVGGFRSLDAAQAWCEREWRKEAERRAST